MSYSMGRFITPTLSDNLSSSSTSVIIIVMRRNKPTRDGPPHHQNPPPCRSDQWMGSLLNYRYVNQNRAKESHLVPFTIHSPHSADICRSRNSLPIELIIRGVIWGGRNSIDWNQWSSELGYVLLSFNQTNVDQFPNNNNPSSWHDDSILMLSRH